MKRLLPDIAGIVAGIAICEAVGGLGSLATASAIPGWYAALAKPAFTPPNWIFGPVWTALFALMGAASYLVWRRRRERAVGLPLGIFAFQLLLNLLWSVAFFGFHLLFFAVLEIGALWLAILLSVIAFHRVDRLAAYLLLPYIAWVSFAAVLTFSIWRLN